MFYQRFDGTKIAIAVLCLGALVVLSGIEIVLAVKRNQKIREQQKINDMISLQLRNTKENIRVSEALSRIKHDIRHMVSLLADSGVSDETIRAYEQELNSAEVPIQTGSQILNYILQTEQERAAVKGIHLHCMLNITSKLFLSEEDLIVLVLISLDNAIEQLSNAMELKFTLKSNREVVLIKVENPVDHQRFADYLDYLKQGKRSRKYGLRSAKVIAEKNGGDILVKCEDGVFSFSAVAHAEKDKLEGRKRLLDKD